MKSVKTFVQRELMVKTVRSDVNARTTLSATQSQASASVSQVGQDLSVNDRARKILSVRVAQRHATVLTTADAILCLENVTAVQVGQVQSVKSNVIRGSLAKTVPSNAIVRDQRLINVTLRQVAVFAKQFFAMVKQ